MNFNDVFTFKNIYQSCIECCKGVRWKTSTKNFEMELIRMASKLYDEIHSNTFKTKGFYEFTLRERGKERKIQAVHITERAIQKCLCTYCLHPLLDKRLIYDSGATLKGKGITFTIKRLKKHLWRYFKNNSNIGYILKIDFSKYFENINHKILLEKVRKIIKDDRLFNLYKYFINNFKGDKGLGLGSEISQISSLFYISELDHFIKEKLHIKYYGRYMDDCYLICNNKEKLQNALIEIIKICDKLKIIVNIKKTKIERLHKGFIFLNRHILLNQSGKVLIRLSYKTRKRLNRKLKYIEKTYGKESINYKQFIPSYNSYMRG